jgi:hypothetical protein
VTIFDYIKDITTTKKGTLLLEQYVPYLVTRWLSFINPTVTEAVNEFNKQVLIEDKELHYKILLTAFPKTKSLPRITYIKKVKEEKEKENNIVKLLAEKYELGEREIKSMLETVS